MNTNTLASASTVITAMLDDKPNVFIPITPEFLAFMGVANIEELQVLADAKANSKLEEWAKMLLDSSIKKVRHSDMVTAELEAHGDAYVIEKYNLRAFYASLETTPEKVDRSWWAHDAAEAMSA